MLRQVQLLSDKSASCFLAKTFREATRVVCSQHPLADPGVAVLGAQSVRDRRNVTTIPVTRQAQARHTGAGYHFTCVGQSGVYADLIVPALAIAACVECLSTLFDVLRVRGHNYASVRHGRANPHNARRAFSIPQRTTN